MKKKRISKKIVEHDNNKHIGLAVQTIGYQPVEESVHSSITEVEQGQNQLLRMKSQYKINETAQEEQVIEHQEPENKNQTEVIYSNFSYVSLLRKLKHFEKKPSVLKSYSSSWLQNFFPLPEISNTPNLEESQSSTESYAELLTDINIYETNEPFLKEDNNEVSTDFTSETIEDDELLACPSNYLETETKKELNYEDIHNITLGDDEEDPNKPQMLSQIQDLMSEQIASDTVLFLSALIDEVVDKYECKYSEPNMLLQHNLNKPLLINQLIKKLAQLKVERKKRVYLIKSVGMFCNSKGQYRVFAEDTPQSIEALKQNYQDTLMKLDISLEKEENLKIKVQMKKMALEGKLSLLQNKNDTKLLELERLVEETIGNKKEHLKMVKIFFKNYKF